MSEYRPLREQSRKVGPYVLLFALLYSAFGAASPFLPALIRSSGVTAEQIGLVFGLGTAIRLLSAPVAGRIADRTQSLRLTLAVCSVATALVALGYLPAVGFWWVLAISLLHAVALAPTTILADAIAVTAAARRGFEYGWVRGTASAAFIVASIAAGLAVSRFGLSAVVVMQAGLMVGAAVSVVMVEAVMRQDAAIEQKVGGFRELFRLPIFRRIVAASALILGSHALHDTFAVIRWLDAGIAPQTASVLWSLAVGAEVGVFFFIGPWIVDRIGSGRAIMLAAIAGAFRWVVAALTLDVIVLVFIQPLHGITFALLHLACMRLIVASVPPRLAATAQAIYGTVGVGTATAILTVIAGALYAVFAGAAFLFMSVLCVLALPIARGLVRAERAAVGRPRRSGTSSV